MVNMMTMYLSACQQQRVPFEYSHTRTAALVVSDTDTSVCCATYVRSITVSDIFRALYLSNSVGRDSVDQCFSNCGPRTTIGPRVLPLWSS
jgi:hypothetical protein